MGIRHFKTDDLVVVGGLKYVHVILHHKTRMLIATDEHIFHWVETGNQYIIIYIISCQLYMEYP